MTRSAYLAVLAVLSLVAMGGLYLAGPRPDALWPRELDCATWDGAPVQGRVRLIGCEVDARYPTFHHVGPSAQDALATVLLPSSPERPEPPTLYLYSDAPELLSWVDQIIGFERDELRHVRYADRHQDRLLRPRDLEGVLGPPEGRAAELVALEDDAPPNTLVLDETTPSPVPRMLGGMLLLIGLLGALALVLVQRKWTRASARLTGQVRPLRF